ncbi:MCE family protein [Saccharomonospora saliphila]|uniref:MCE family protein n=1 Tax=Saccharomonospora saliphila TaxID=369829 RepID=UPI00048ECF21|nr:MCE family protein [Saccharomonospora saliphila]
MRQRWIRKLGVRLAGTVFLLVLALLVSLSVRIYNKDFTDSVSVTLRTGHVGNQLRENSDVKARGVLVGEVRGIRATGDGAEIDLALEPDSTPMLPTDVTALLVPKTLFGERYVQLSIPSESTAAPLTDGDVITQDRSANAVELERVFDELLPVLRAVQPQKLASTLGAVATALDGRGERIGDTLGAAADYLHEFNPNLPKLHQNLRDLTEVSHVYGDIAPDLLDALTDTATTLTTVDERGDDLRGLYERVDTTSAEVTGFLRRNADNLIRLSATSRRGLELASKYSPAFACTLTAMEQLKPAMDAVLGAGTGEPGLHLEGTITTEPRGAYEPGRDTPSYTATGGPRCYPSGLDPSSSNGVLPPEHSGAHPLLPAETGGPDATGESELPHSPQERHLLSTLLAPELDVEAGAVPQWSSALVGPLYRGREVTVE